MRLFAVQRIMGALLALASLVKLPPLVLSWWLDEGLTTMWRDSLLIGLAIGFLLWLPVRNVRDELRLRDGFLITTFTWILVSATCAIPFVMGPPKLSFTDAYFESVSGLTTTGATVIVGLDLLPKSVLMYRQLLCFLGGMGIVILAVAILPMLRIGGSQLFRAETTGPVKDTRLTPRIAETARVLWLLYVALNVSCALAYWAAGMTLFDAVGHAFSTIATAGFSTHDDSIGYFDSGMIEAISIVFMLMGATSFSLHFAAWHRASTAPYFHDAEFRAFIAITLGISAVVGFGVYATATFPTLAESMRHALFHTVSNITTTGYGTTFFYMWPSFMPMLLILIGFIGGCSGSTTGGLKVARVVMLWRQGAREILQLVHPRARFVVKLGGTTVSGQVLAAVTGFCTLYVLSYVVMALLLAATGLDLVTAWSAVAACLNNMGPGLGQAGVHFQDINDPAVWICSFAMILGRLEVFTVLVLFTPAFWRE